MGAESTEVLIPDDLSAGMMLNFLEELEEQLEGGSLTPEYVSYALQLVRHLISLSEDSLEWVKGMKKDVEKLPGLNPPFRRLLLHDLNRYPTLPPKEASKVVDRLYRATETKISSGVQEKVTERPEKESQDSLGGATASDPFI